MPQIPLVYDNADILIVDDNPINVEVIFQLLEDYGYNAVRSEIDSRDVESILAEKMPDLILLDIRMPHIDGYQILELLKDRWPEQAPPVIVLSAQIDAETRLQSLNLGARDFLSKPFDRLEVLQRIHNTLELHFLLQDRSDRAALLEDLVKQRTADLQRVSLADPVTERPNRRGLLAVLQEQLHQELQQVSSIKAMAVQSQALHSAEAILYFIVLEGMDDIARMHGYHTSEMLSKAVGDRLQRCATLYENNQTLQQLGVWGGNEWLLLEFGHATEDTIAKRANQLIEFMNQPFKVDGLLLHIGVRIGISHSGFVYQSAEDLVRLASMALPAKHNSWQWYQPEVEQQMLSLNRCRQAMRGAIDNHEFFLVYQPKVDLQQGHIIGAEALLRWVSPELGFVSPADFIPIAESSGEILRIGEWVISEAIKQLEYWISHHQLPDSFRVAVNVAALQLSQPNFADTLIAQLNASTIPLSAIEVEVTESGLMQNVDLAISQLNRLVEQGISIAIDDFGTGYSSLAYLKTMPVSVLKIDRAFIKDMDTDCQDRRLAETVINMARNLGCDTVAEGVERSEHIELLKEMGCTIVQGYWYSPPLKPDAFINFAHNHQQQLEKMKV